MKPAVSPHEARICADARRQFAELRGEEGASRRAAEIERLPRVEWKGKQLRTLLCRGTSGRGPHPVNILESHLWCLVSLDRYCCPYHAGDLWSLPFEAGAEESWESWERWEDEDPDE